MMSTHCITIRSTTMYHYTLNKNNVSPVCRLFLSSTHRTNVNYFEMIVVFVFFFYLICKPKMGRIPPPQLLVIETDCFPEFLRQPQPTSTPCGLIATPPLPRLKYYPPYTNDTPTLWLSK